MLLVALVWAPLAGTASEKTEYPPMPEAFSSFGAAVNDGFVYVYGGHIAKTHTYSTEAVTNKFRRLSLKDPSKDWEELPTGPHIQGLALVAHGGKLYRIGGMQPRNMVGEKSDNHSLASFASYDPKAGKWQDLPDLPEGRSSHDATVVGDRIVVAGGWHMMGRGNKSNWLDTTLVCDLSKSPLKWETVKQPFQRRALNLAAIGQKVYVVGGMNSDNETERKVDILDLATMTWSAAPPLPGISRNGFTPAACVLEGRLFVSPADGSVYRLTDAKSAWESIGMLQTKRIVHRIVPAGKNRLLVLGGASPKGNVANVEIIAAPQGAPAVRSSAIGVGATPATGK